MMCVAQWEGTGRGGKEDEDPTAGGQRPER